MALISTIQPTDNIQSYLDLLHQAGGGILYLNSGTFFLDDNLTIFSNCRLQGTGSGGTIIDFSNQAFQIQIIGDAMTPIDSAFLEGFTVQNSSIELIKASYTNNFGGSDVKCVNGLVGTSIDNSTIFNWDINTIDTCVTGILMDTVAGFTINNAFVTNITMTGSYICTNATNGVFVNSSLDTVIGVGFSFTDCGNIGVDQVSITNVDGIGFLADSISGSFSITNGLISNSTGDALKIQNSSSQMQVATMQFSNNTGYGVNIDDVGSTNNLFVANTFASNTAGEFNDNGTGTLIRSNIGVADN